MLILRMHNHSNSNDYYTNRAKFQDSYLLYQMKNSFLLTACFVLITTVSDGQYKVNKKKYDYHSFSQQAGDPYNPSIAGFASLLVPGMGQMTSGETGRGAAFLCGFVGCIVIIGIGASSYYEMDGVTYGGPGLIYLGFIGAITVDLISVIDAVRVAKVNNLVFRNRNKRGFSMQMSPYLGSLDNNKIPVGLVLKLRF